MSERESWEKELEALGRDSAAEGAEPVETAAGETETGAEQSFAEEAEERARAAERDFERRLEKAIDRRIRNICLKTFAVAAAVCMVVFLIVRRWGYSFPRRSTLAVWAAPAWRSIWARIMKRRGPMWNWCLRTINNDAHGRRTAALGAIPWG